jgi:hypothetical protein
LATTRANKQSKQSDNGVTSTSALSKRNSEARTGSRRQTNRSMQSLIFAKSFVKGSGGGDRHCCLRGSRLDRGRRCGDPRVGLAGRFVDAPACPSSNPNSTAEQTAPACWCSCGRGIVQQSKSRCQAGGPTVCTRNRPNTLGCNGQARCSVGSANHAQMWTLFVSGHLAGHGAKQCTDTSCATGTCNGRSGQRATPGRPRWAESATRRDLGRLYQPVVCARFRSRKRCEQGQTNWDTEEEQASFAIVRPCSRKAAALELAEQNDQRCSPTSGNLHCATSQHNQHRTCSKPPKQQQHAG